MKLICIYSFLIFVIALYNCASFTASKSAEINPGISFHLKAGSTTSPSEETFWFYDIGSDNPLGVTNPIGIMEVGFFYGHNPFSAGVLLSGTEIQIEIYSQLKNTNKLDYGVGGRFGFPSGWYSHQLFILLDYRLNEEMKLLINPGIFYHTGESPNGLNTGSLLFYTQSLGILIESDNFTFSPVISLIKGSGELSVLPQRNFSDTFLSFSLGFSIHKSKN